MQYLNVWHLLTGNLHLNLYPQSFCRWLLSEHNSSADLPDTPRSDPAVKSVLCTIPRDYKAVRCGKSVLHTHDVSPAWIQRDYSPHRYRDWANFLTRYPTKNSLYCLKENRATIQRCHASQSERSHGLETHFATTYRKQCIGDGALSHVQTSGASGRLQFPKEVEHLSRYFLAECLRLDSHPLRF